MRRHHRTAVSDRGLWGSFWSIDHGKGNLHRGSEFGVVYTAIPQPAPVTGATNPLNSPTLNLPGSEHRGLTLDLNAAMPQFSFPKFDGSNPKLWIKNCETFFDIYVVPEHRWVKLGTMNFTGSAQLWL